jgi:hypothetical protein
LGAKEITVDGFGIEARISLCKIDGLVKSLVLATEATERLEKSLYF